ncbi:phosphonate C-P lyase system protein PhnG [Roseovarius indicus]|uniref:Alpha-D-ribose 1-methylphosphonate 5-triphosphate synthase subunit PhnG n=1 Tax=Roseovarius indicus TaxID=540747 RepID=A0A0T5P1X1_9RHOB|nr:phosphonate C-P lyase system protein PhnG [Roseovarius indicus]KRS15123.1 phosphonate metabolism protein PhnG [Roseovarius indicus]QEW24767.1 Alpha-D-ribose 1-methylphosphonate 5-triphosphate synthase subunit PhnG [Roseovarius indicus]SFE51959.1 alpha-D-ribose 1-methylphosphonate 5-triphosphate synthase subunit PhnG [Roseovarius indicus]
MTANDERKAWMSLLAKAPAAELARLWEAFGDEPGHEWLRAPEAGGVMVRGRAGATGAPFNLGEMTVTRCSLKLEGGAVGHAYVQGRDKRQARQAALVDALMQTGEAATVREAILDPLAGALEAARAARAAKAAATKVDFFTMVRGED